MTYFKNLLFSRSASYCIFSPYSTLTPFCRTLSCDLFNSLTFNGVWRINRNCYRYYVQHKHGLYPDIRTPEAATALVINLTDKGRTLLLEELSKMEEAKALQDSSKNGEAPMTPSITNAQLWNVFVFNCVPFIGFGILDNLIMIVAGEYIDAKLGVILGISTMAAAALGNIISDIAGIGMAGYIELLVSKVGVHPPHITPSQTLLQKTRWSAGLGRSIGITLGCFIGMFPLLFYDDDEKRKAAKAAKAAEEEREKAGEELKKDKK